MVRSMVYLLTLCVISILNMQFLLTQRTRWVLKWVIRKNSLIFLQQQDQLFTFCGHQQLQRCRISLKHKKIWGRGRAWRFSWRFRAQSRMGQGTIVLEEQEENFHIIHFPNLESTSIYTMTILKPLMETNPLNWITMNNIVKGFVTVTEETVLLLFNVSQHIETTQETVYFSAWRCV